MIKRNITGKYSEPYNFVLSKYEFRFNVILSRFQYRRLNKGKVIKNSPWLFYDDRVKESILFEILENDFSLGEKYLKTLIESEKISEDYNPFLEYFDDLKPWDEKTDYISQLAKTVKTDNDERFPYVLKKFLVGSVDCLLKEDNVNDVCLVFQSHDQGVGKSRWMRRLLPERFQKQYLYEGSINTKNNDHTKYLSEFWFIHLDELEALTSNEIAAIKSYITRQRISLRSAYGRYKSNYIRRASFLGSVNDDKFLTDTTGNRRWLVFKTLRINYNHNIDIDGLWSQVYHYWLNGFRHWFNIDEIKDINKQNEKFRDISLEEEIVLKNFYFPNESDPKGEWMSTSDVLSKIGEVSPKLLQKMRPNVIGRALTFHCSDGLKKRKQGVSKYWVKFVGVISESSMNVFTDNPTGKPDLKENDDLPF